MGICMKCFQIDLNEFPKVALWGKKDRTMLPARFVAESLGATVTWDEASRKVIIAKNSLLIEITIDSDTALVNGRITPLDSPAFIENDRTYMPLRFIVENLGATVIWDKSEQKVTITVKFPA